LHERNLIEIAPYLGTSRQDSLRARLQKWLPGGQYAGLFDNKEDRFDLTVDYCCFDMTEIFKDEVPLELTLAYLIHRIDLVTNDGRPFIIVCEEGQRWVRSKFMSPILDNWLERVRKLNGMVIFITPDLSQTSGALAKQTVTQIFMGDDKGRREDYIDKFGLSESEFEWVREVDEHARQALIKHGSESVIAQFNLSGGDLEKYLPILAGNPERAELMHQIFAELGTRDPDIWIPVFLERCARKH
jgi:type IV secretion system protein VirB4